MIYDEFLSTMQKLVTTINPSRWGSEQETAYYDVFRSWTLPKFQKAIQEAVTKWNIAGRMPTPAQLREFGGEETEGNVRKSTAKNLLPESGCNLCNRGMIPVEVLENGILYEKYAACDCPSGDRVAKHMVQMSKLMGRPIVESQTRYNFVMMVTR